MSQNEKKGQGGEHTRSKKWSGARRPAGPATTALLFSSQRGTCGAVPLEHISLHHRFRYNIFMMWIPNFVNMEFYKLIIGK